MESSAEILLQSHGIKDLRDIVDDLSAKAKSKKEELQLMVGSKYHDFIQSADAIAVMKDHAEDVGKKLEKFATMNASLITKTKSLLESDCESGAATDTTTGLSTAAEEFMEMDSSDVWACLDECDVYTAAKIVLLADIIRSPPSSSSPLVEYLVGDIQEVIVRKRDDFVMTSNLLSTVIEDCYLLLLVPESSRERKVQALCSLGLLTGKSSKDLLECFLQSADIILEDIVLSSNNSNHSTKLHDYVMCLQQIILDLYFSFGGDGGSGAISSFKASFLSELNMHIKCEMFDSQKALNFGSLGDLTLRDIFDPWLGKVLKKASLLTDKALGHLDSAVEVSRLQYEVWKTSTYKASQRKKTREYSLLDWREASVALLGPLSTKQISAKKSFLGNLVGTNESHMDNATDGESLLWSLLRAPFVTHAERLLRSSCLGVLRKTKRRLLGVLESEGVLIDPLTFDLSMKTIDSRPSSEDYDSSSSVGCENTPFTDFNAYRCRSQVESRTHLPSSPTIFKHAETVKSLFESEIVAMVANMQAGMQFSSPSTFVSTPALGTAPSAGQASGVSDPQATVTLTKAIFVQTSQLVAHFLTMLRCLRSSYERAIKERHKHLQKEEVRLMSASGFTNVDAYQDPHMGSLLLGILVLGRISWSLKTRGNFLSNIFSSTMAAYHSSGISNSRRFNLSSDDQLRSAFEIADANGDGLLTVEEAIEAIQAIDVSQRREVNYCEFLTSDLTPSLSLPELALMCCDLLAPEACTPLEHCVACLDSIVDKAHVCWCDIMIEDLGESLRANISSEFGSVGQSRDFKALWELSAVSLDDCGAENVLLPATASSSLTTFLSLLNFRVTRGILSVDTVQDLVPHELGINRGSRACLTAHILGRLKESSVHAVLSAYNQVFQDIYSAQIRPLSKRRDSEWKEECALQALFDLRSLKGLLKSHLEDSTLEPSTENAINKTLRTWETLIDPVNFEFSMPVIGRNLDKYLLASSMLLTGVNGLPSVKTFARTAEDEQQQQQQQQHRIFACAKASEIPKFSPLPLAITMTASRSIADNSSGRKVIRHIHTNDKDGGEEQLNLSKYLSFFNN